MTCSYKCSNLFFKEKQQDAREKSDKVKRNYRTIGLKYHGRKCIVCGEELAVCIHHYDGDHRNNSPENLVPLCPTHHVYWHSKNRYLIEDCVNKYIQDQKKVLLNSAPAV